MQECQSTCQTLVTVFFRRSLLCCEPHSTAPLRMCRRQEKKCSVHSRRDYRRAMQEADLLGNFVRLADSVLVAAVAAQASPLLI